MNNKNRALTLVEVMAAVAILVLTVVSLAQIYPSCVSLSSSSRHRAMAGNLAQAEIERLFNTPYAQVAAAAGTVNQAVTIDPDTNLAGNMATQLTAVQQVAGNNDYKVIVTVTWDESGRQISETLESVITSYF